LNTQELAPKIREKIAAAAYERKFRTMADTTKQTHHEDNEDPARREQRIRECAYRMWEADGRPEGTAEQYWNRAQELIEDESRSAYPPAASRGNRT
jgi:Protein of unknown function (DUF2934)